MQTQPALQVSDPTTQPALRGGQLVATRALWGAGILLALGVFLASLPGSIEAALNTSTATQMGGGQLGFSGPFFADFRAVTDSVTVLAFLVVAIWLVVRRSNNRLFLFLSLTLVLTGVNYTDTFYTLYVRQWPSTPLTVLVGSLAALAEICQLAAFFVFPDGHFVPRWLRWLLAAWIPYRLLGWTVAYPLHLPAGIRVVDLLIQFAFFGVGIAAQVYRYRRANTAIQRQQTKWIIFGMTVAVLALVTYSVIGVAWPGLAVPGQGRLIYVVGGTLMTRIALLLIPISVGTSILRFHLWDIDLIINRSLVYGALAALVIGLFAGSTLLLERLFQSLSGGQSAVIAIAISGAVFGALFQPVHRELQSFVDRRFYGIRVDYQPRRHTGPLMTPSVGSGSQIGGYEMLERLGRGGMAEVYKGRQPSLDRLVAIKMLPETLAQQSDFRLRFEREAKVVASLRHPNIVNLFDFGESGDIYYMVMEYLSGQNLGNYLRERGACTLDETRHILGEIASALDYAHAQGVVHRDIKPSNVMLEPVTAPDGKGQRAVLMDFGIARMAGGGTKITGTGIIGTFDYMAPEQIRDAKDVDGRADIYSLGVMAYQMLTGKLPFAASNPGAVLIAHMQQPAPDPRTLRPDLPEEVADAILKALEKDPDNRFATAGAMVAAMG